jgi:hypothetical protein
MFLPIIAFWENALSVLGILQLPSPLLTTWHCAAFCQSGLSLNDTQKGFMPAHLKALASI